MANEPVVTLIGNATSDAELRALSSGVDVANFTLASTPRVKQGDQWVDGEAMFVRCAVWRRAAENVAETVTKGMRLIVQGRLKVRSYEKDGQTRTSLEMDVDAIGPELTFARASVTKTGGGESDFRKSGGSAASSDPWPTDSIPPF